jgi:transposase
VLRGGPTGYELQRLLSSLGVPCLVVAPSLIPTAPGNRVKTDTRDARHLVRQFRAGELTAIRVPTPAEEAVRDLCRARGDAVEDLTRAKNRLEAFLLRHGRVYRGGSTWTFRHRYWLAAQSFEDPALRTTFGRYLATVECREAERAAIEADLAPYLEQAPFAEPVRRLAAYRGVDRLGALVLQAEVCDWRRFASGGAAGAFYGLVPSEYSSGASVHRGALTHAGNAHLRRQLVEAAWSYRFGPSLGPALLRRQQGVAPETRGAGLGHPGRPLPPLSPARREEVGARRGRRGDRAPPRRLPPRGDGGLTRRWFPLRSPPGCAPVTRDRP